MLAKLDAVVAEATEAFEAFDYARALERTESFFWWFCDDYVELVKGRGYGSRGDDGGAVGAGRAARSRSSALQRLLAPILPFAAEETWSWWQSGSIHAQPWPEPVAAGGDPDLIDPVLEVLARVRRTKTEAKVSQRAEVARLVVTLPAASHDIVPSRHRRSARGRVDRRRSRSSTASRSTAQVELADRLVSGTCPLAFPRCARSWDVLQRCR